MLTIIMSDGKEFIYTTPGPEDIEVLINNITNISELDISEVQKKVSDDIGILLKYDIFNGCEEIKPDGIIGSTVSSVFRYLKQYLNGQFDTNHVHSAWSTWFQHKNITDKQKLWLLWQMIRTNNIRDFNKDKKRPDCTILATLEKDYPILIGKAKFFSGLTNLFNSYQPHYRGNDIFQENDKELRSKIVDILMYEHALIEAYLKKYFGLKNPLGMYFSIDKENHLKRD